MFAYFFPVQLISVSTVPNISDNSSILIIVIQQVIYFIASTPIFSSRLELDQSLCSRLVKNAESTLTASNRVSSFDDILRAAIAASVFNASNNWNRVDPGSRLHGSPRSAHDE
mmetsp:Transcript_5426/g.11196  ORF Transcript_5426/g.11196 Transcript_5426/m.11196 type:complete len:113 (-) Transcript_5426:66-404(-)